MARKKIDKREKREELALKAYEFISLYGDEEFSINSFLKYLNMGKSSLYHYFKTKEEIIYEMLYVSSYHYFEQQIAKMQNATSLRERLDIYFEFYLINSDENLVFRRLYRQFLFTCKDEKTSLMKEREKRLLVLFDDLLQTAFKDSLRQKRGKKELSSLARSLMATADGMLIYSFVFEDFSLSATLRAYLDNFVSLLKT